MKLVCVYISEHHQLQNLFIPLTSEFIFDLNGGALKVRINELYTADYYEGVNLKAVIGKNGSGKTSVLDFIESIHSESESSGFCLFFDSNQKVFYKKVLNISSIDVLLCGKLQEYSVQNSLLLNDHRIVKINNLSNFSSNRKPKMKNVVDLTSEKLSNSKRNRTKQLENLFTYFNRKGNKVNDRNVIYTFKFRGWTPALKNWIKESYLYIITRDGFFHENRELFLNLPEINEYPLSEVDKLIVSLDKIREPSDIPEKLQSFISELLNLFLESVSMHICCDEGLCFLVPPDSKLHDSTSSAILAKGILNIFRNNILKFKIDESLSADLCVNLVKKLFFNMDQLYHDNDYTQLGVHSIIANVIERAIEKSNSRERINYNSTIELFKKFEYGLHKDLKIFFEVVRNICCVNSVSEEASDLIGIWSEPQLKFQGFLYSLKYIFPSESYLYNGYYPGLEQVKVSDPLDILYVSGEINKLPKYLQSNIDHGWQGLSSGEFAKTSLFSSIYNFLIADETHGFKLFLIDEADLYLHPEWQRKFIFELIELIKSIGLESKTQFIITTHSPLIIGDFLPEDILALKVEDGRTILHNSLGFGTKLSDFYLEGMHLDSTYGEHSRAKLQVMIDAKLHGIPLTKEQIKLANKICNKALQEALLND